MTKDQLEGRKAIWTSALQGSHACDYDQEEKNVSVFLVQRSSFILVCFRIRDFLSPMATIRTGFIDAHAHWAPQDYTSYLARFGRQPGTTQSPLMSDLAARTQWMDSRAKTLA